jgi:hypothetical protein
MEGLRRSWNFVVLCPRFLWSYVLYSLLLCGVEKNRKMGGAEVCVCVYVCTVNSVIGIPGSER